ncbi:MAG: ACT domain-containing protein [Acidimicrobiales bacterium]|nr:ACT domain-containing protein [Acidimicrobiales bacterium]
MVGSTSVERPQSSYETSCVDVLNSITVTHVVIEVSLPDRPGALGAVASRIGAVGGDITDVIVARRTDGFADDVFHVEMPIGRDDVDMVGLVLDEISQVDGVVAPSIAHTDAENCCR